MRKYKVAGVATAVALALAVGQSAQAVEISTDNWTGSWDTTVSFGSSWRVEERDLKRIGHTNIIELEHVPDPNDPNDLPNYGLIDYSRGGWSNNGDDGNLNFDKGDAFSTAIKFTTEIGLQHNNGFGFFIRGTGFYDSELMSNPKGREKPISEQSLEQQGEDYRLLDAYIYQTWDFAESSLQARLGRQVVSWGESTFIQHGLSEINAIDVTKLRVPGSELKEALIPVNTLWASYDLSDTLSLETFAQFEWESFRTDESGTYFATQDFTGASTYAGEDEFGIPITTNVIHLGFSAGIPEGTPGTLAYRVEDKEARDDGQFGVKLAWLAEDWNYTEFGFYYVNYHNKRPVISAFAHDGVATTGFFEYLEDIQRYGFSFNTSTDSGYSIAGEITYRQDEPLQVDDVELLFATLERVGSIPSGTSQIGGAAALGAGAEISGYRLMDTVQYQATITKFMGPTWGADQWVLLTEIGANSILDMPSQDELRFNGPGSSRSGNEARAQVDENGIPTGLEGYIGEEFFADDFSWGYRVVSKWDYTDVIGGWNMSPRVVYQHDVKGTTPGPISNFVEDRKALTIGLGMDYQSKWKADIGYSSFFGAGTRNVMGDRDFIAANISYSF